MPISPEEVLSWNVATKHFRDSLDLATIINFWLKVRDDLDASKIMDIVRLLMKDDIVFIEPKELWSSVLEHPYRDPSFECYDVGSRSCIINKLDDKKHRLVIDEYENKTQPVKKYGLAWLYRYRNSVAPITPFSDYWHIHRFQEYNSEEVHIVYWQCFMDDERNGWPCSIASMKKPYDGCSPADVLVNSSVHPVHDFDFLYGDYTYTHTFINFDKFIQRCEEEGYEVPKEFYLPKVKSASPEKGADNSGTSLLPDLKFSKGSKFHLLEVAPRVLEWLRNDSKVQKSIKRSTGKHKNLKTNIIRLMGFDPNKDDGKDYSCLLAVLLPKELRYGAEADLRIEIVNAIEKIWRGDGIDNYWLASGADADVRVQAIRGMVIGNQGACSENEAEFLLKFISPNNLSKSQGFDRSVWANLLNELESLKPDSLVYY